MFPGNRETVRTGRPPALSAPGVRPKAPATPDRTEPPPAEDADTVPPNPAALGYRTEAESCGHCTYMSGSNCSHPLIAQPVAAGDSCAAFEAKVGAASDTGDMAEGEPAPSAVDSYGE